MPSVGEFITRHCWSQAAVIKDALKQTQLTGCPVYEDDALTRDRLILLQIALRAIHNRDDRSQGNPLDTRYPLHPGRPHRRIIDIINGLLGRTCCLSEQIPSVVYQLPTEKLLEAQ